MIEPVTPATSAAAWAATGASAASSSDNTIAESGSNPGSSFAETRP